MTSVSEAPPEPVRARLALLGGGAAWLLGLAAAVHLLSVFIGSASLAEAVLGALVVDLAAGRAGVTWALDAASRKALAVRTLKAAAFPLGILVVTLIVSSSAGWHKSHAGRLDGYFLISLIGVVAAAIRDELLLRGIPLHFAAKAGVPKHAAIAFAACLSPAPFLLDGATPAGVALSVSSGLLFATLYARFHGAWAAIAAHATWSAILGPVARGGAFDLQWVNGELVEGAKASGPVAWMAAGLAAAAAIGVVPRVAPALVPAPTPDADAEPKKKKKAKAKAPESDEAAPRKPQSKKPRDASDDE